MPVRRPIAVALVAVLGVGAVAMSATSAQAASSDLSYKIVRNDRAQLRDKRSASVKLGARMARAEQDFTDDRARRGRPVDSKRVSAVTDPTGSVIVTGADTDVVDGVDLVSYQTPQGALVVRGAAVRTHEATAASAGTGSSPALGFAGVPTTSGYQLVSNGGVTITSAMDPDLVIAGTTQYVRSEYWKYALPESQEAGSFSSSYRSGSDFWAYARRGLADARTSGARLVDLTIRSRPWAGTSGRFRNTIDYAPVGTSSACNGSGEIGFSYGGASVAIPLSNCQSTTGLSSVSSSLEFGADWNGRTGDQQAVEAIASVRTLEGQTPSWADYIWASFAATPLAYANYYNVKWTDPGW